MNWPEAVDAMKQGHLVRRVADICDQVLPGGIPFRGVEPIRLLHAWTHDEKAVQVFAGAWSRLLFVPEDDHRAATDWHIHREESMC